MRNKQQAIQEAYGEYWETVKDFVTSQGWCKAFWNLFEVLDGITNPKSEGTLWRPKSLQGIENNNGWIKIESEEDLPKEQETFHVVLKNGNVYMRTFVNKASFSDVTHYQQFKKPKPPIF